MIQTSQAYKEAILKNRILYHKVRIVLADGEEIIAENRQLMAFSYEDAVSSDSSFDIGAAIINSFQCTLDNSSGTYTEKDFTGAVVYPSIGLLLQDGTTEWMDKGIYYVNGSPKMNITVTLSCLDRMSLFERLYSESQLSYPATVQSIVNNACLDCGVPFGGKVPNGTFLVSNVPSGEITYLTIISECAKVAGCWARMNHEGILQFDWYKTYDEIWLDGGIFDSENPYISGDNTNGGYFDLEMPYASGNDVNGGSFEPFAKQHHIYSMSSNTLETKEIKITGVCVVCDDTEYMAGMEGYVISIESLFADAQTVQSLAAYLTNRIAGLTFYKSSIKAISDPSVEAGDTVVFTDRKYNSYRSQLTRVEYSAGSGETYTTSGETISENTSTVYMPGTKVLQKANREADKNMNKRLTEYDKSVQNMTSIITQAFGLYRIEVPQEDGSTKFYMCDGPTIEASSSVWQFTSGGILQSKDGGATWGIDADGNALFNSVMAHKISADWIKVGGSGSDGILVVYDADGEELIRLCNSGIIMADGTSLISSSGVCGDLTFTSGGVPYDIGVSGNSAIGYFVTQEIDIQAYIPENYVITHATLILSLLGTYWQQVTDDYQNYSSVYGYPRGVKAYVGSHQVYKRATWDGEYAWDSDASGEQIISGGFASGGVDGTSSVTVPKVVTSGDISKNLTKGLNCIRLIPSGYTGSSNIEAAKRTGTGIAILNIKGYTKN